MGKPTYEEMVALAKKSVQVRYINTKDTKLLVKIKNGIRVAPVVYLDKIIYISRKL